MNEKLKVLMVLEIYDYFDLEERMCMPCHINQWLLTFPKFRVSTFNIETYQHFQEIQT